MGMDVFGKNPTSEKGKYFRNNCWWWRPLWDYSHAVAGPDIISDELHKSGHYNDGEGLDSEGAVKLADKLQAEIDSGRTESHAQEYAAERAAIPDEKCPLCHGTGERHDRIVEGKCNGCDGKGKRRPYAAGYPFSTENVQEFVEFLRDCGGFEIC